MVKLNISQIEVTPFANIRSSGSVGCNGEKLASMNLAMAFLSRTVPQYPSPYEKFEGTNSTCFLLTYSASSGSMAKFSDTPMLMKPSGLVFGSKTSCEILRCDGQKRDARWQKHENKLIEELFASRSLGRQQVQTSL